MNESIDGDELARHLILMRVIEKQPRLFSKWVDLKEKFKILGLYDSPFNESTFTISDVFQMINEAFGDDDREPARI